ncbi:MAG: hypothetical protein WAL15_13400, partial [Xanthobacteraceae bacterium]
MVALSLVAPSVAQSRLKPRPFDVPNRNGGGFALEQARAGADFKAVVVFHVTNPNPAVAGTPCNIKG